MPLRSPLVSFSQHRLTLDRIQTDETRNTLGGTTHIYGTEMVETGPHRIALIDDVITAAERMDD